MSLNIKRQCKTTCQGLIFPSHFSHDADFLKTYHHLLSCAQNKQGKIDWERPISCDSYLLKPRCSVILPPNITPLMRSTVDRPSLLPEGPETDTELILSVTRQQENTPLVTSKARSEQTGYSRARTTGLQQSKDYSVNTVTENSSNTAHL